jgi:signal peptidase I
MAIIPKPGNRWVTHAGDIITFRDGPDGILEYFWSHWSEYMHWQMWNPYHNKNLSNYTQLADVTDQPKYKPSVELKLRLKETISKPRPKTIKPGQRKIMFKKVKP